jgi:hypothetical protein
MARAGCIRPFAPSALGATLAALLLAGCATPPRGQRDLFDFLVDGQTPCAQVGERLGTPAAALEDGRISMYRIGEDQNGYKLGSDYPPNAYSGPGIWTGLRYSLVVVCGPSGTVARHSLVPIKTEQGEDSRAQQP